MAVGPCGFFCALNEVQYLTHPHLDESNKTIEMKPILFASVFAFLCSSALAQLPSGSISPDFTATDIDSVEHNLYSYLDSGYQVILDFSATWCPPCWSYHEEGVLKELYNQYGPEGTNELRVFFIEGDDTTTDEDLHGTGSNTAGDWVMDTPYPIIDNAGNIFDDFGCTYFPTIYTICPNKILSESGQASFVGHETLLSSASCMPASMPNDVLLMDYVGQASTCGDNPVSLAIRMMNNGLDTLTECNIQVSKLLPFNATEVMETVSWEGALGKYDLTTVDLIDVVLDANTTYVFDVVSPDDNEANNSTTGHVKTSEDVTNNLQINLKTDGAPEQLGWELLADDGAVIASVLPGTETLEATTEYSWPVTLPSLGCYRLNLLDAGGDGLLNLATSMDGVGFLEVNSLDGVTVVDQDLFYQELDPFSEVSFELHAVEVTSVEEFQAHVHCALYPNPSHFDASLNLTLGQASRVVVTVRNVAGQVVMNSDLGALASGNHLHTMDVQQLESGTYLLEVRTENSAQTLILLHQ